MAYNPKSYLDQALKTGFETTYTNPVSPDYDEVRKDDIRATFGNVTVRPTFEPVYEGTGDAQYQSGSTPSGHVVSVPLTGKYEGYFRNDIYDNDGNFVNTTLSEPDNDKYGLKSLAQLGLMAASMGGLGPVAQGLSSAYKGIQAAKSGDWLSAAASILPNVGLIPGVDKGLADTLKTAGGYAKTASALEKAIESKDVLGLLGAASDIPGVPKVPSDITDVLKGVGQANRIREAIRSENPSAIFNEIGGASKAGGGPGKGFFPDVGGGGYETPGEIQEGFFDVGGEGYMEPEGEDADSYIRSLMNFESGLPQDMSTGAGNLPDWALDPDRPNIDVNAPTTADDWYQEGATPTYSGVPEWDDALDIVLQTGKVPGEAGQTITTTAQKDNLDIDPWLQPFVDTDPRVFTVTEGEPQTITVTGTLPKNDVIIPDWDILPDIMEVPDPTPGTPTDTTPQPPKPDDDRTVAPGPAPTPAPGPAPTPAPTPAPGTAPGMDLSALFAFLGAMGGQQPSQAPAPLQTARINAKSPYGLMYGLGDSNEFG
jgi:hypothetical protein